MKRREALLKANGALEMVELSERAKHYPKQLSGGQQQRVALARAVVFEPALLLMDEPLGALDKRLRTQMQLEIMRISRNLGSTVVYVTHDQEEALVMSDLIAVYNKGSIEQIGTSRDLYETPETRFVADFIGESVLLTCEQTSRGELTGLGWVGDTPKRSRLEDGRGVLVLRPEDLTINTRKAGDAVAPNSIIGEVAEVIYVGSALIYLVQIDNDREIEVRAPRSEAALAIATGAKVVVSWKPDSAVVVPNDETSTVSEFENLSTKQLLTP